MFDRPAPISLVGFLRRSAPILGLTDALSDEICFQAAVERLSFLRLVPSTIEGGKVQMDAHPLVREHFGNEMRDSQPALWSEAHGRLYDYLRNPSTPPNTIEELDPVFQAIMHGCKAGRYRDVLHQVYYPHVMRGQERFAAEYLGALGPLVSVLSHFFDRGKWGQFGRPISQDQGIPQSERLDILLQASEYLTATRGYAAPEVEETCAAAVDLSKELRDAASEQRARYGLWRYWLVSGNLNKAMELATEMSRVLAANPGLGDEHELATHRVRCSTSFFMGRFADAIKFGNDALTVFQRIGLRFGPKEQYGVHTQELGIVSLSHSAMALWHCGDLSEAVQRSNKALGYSSEAGRAHGHAMALFCDVILRQLCRDIVTMEADATELTALCTKHGLSFWLIAGVIMKGRAQAALGLRTADRSELNAGRDEMLRGLELWKGAGARLANPFWLSQLAEIQLLVSQQFHDRSSAKRGHELIAEAIEDSLKRNERWLLPDLYRLRGDICAAAGYHANTSMRYYHEAFELALEMGSKSLQLRTALSMYRLSAATRSELDLAASTVFFLRIRMPSICEQTYRGLLNWTCQHFQVDVRTDDLTDARELLMSRSN
jgi:hypothetical protein